MKSEMKQESQIAVLMGGSSSERDISLMSGKAVYDALVRQGINAHAIDVSDDIISVLMREPFDGAVVMLHGRQGEDGTIQALLDLMRIPYTGSGVQASAIAMDKVRSKWIVQAVGLPTLPSIVLRSKDDLAAVEESFEFPVCIKPAREGSSRGVVKVDSAAELEEAFEIAYAFDKTVLAEPWLVAAREFTVAILEDNPLPVVEIKATKSFYDYEAKYFTNDTQYLCPADLSLDETALLQKHALAIYHAMGCRQLARIDFLEDSVGNFYFMEINTIPGFTEHSLLPMAAKQAGITFDQLVLMLVADLRCG